ncbi:MAG: glycoside hydrolase family 3 C-terminal domain-containing protein [Treponema sp.]|nr:glycoside hydrolase family 3 C-terminal domain-containing protein [Treponema sp.]
MSKLFDTSLSAEERAASAVAEMTLEEKASQLLYGSAAIPRLGIPAYHWWNEAAHGLANSGTATVFPQAIGMGAMFDTDLVKEIADVTSDEVRAKYNDYKTVNADGRIWKGITLYAPNINIFRDPRWGRGHETFGEDPYLTARTAMAFIGGLQGNDPKYRKCDANVKHYMVHSGPENLRHEMDIKVSQKQIRETYLYAFAECIRKANVACVMGAYNRVNGEPCCANKYFLKDILRDELGFTGYTVSDSFAVHDFHLHHKSAGDIVESAAKAINAGCDSEGGFCYEHLPEAVRRGLVDEKDIDKAVVHMLSARVKLGMFDPAEDVPYNKLSGDIVDCEKHRMLALRAAEKSAVLLKNDGILPLKKEHIKKIAVIGPNASSLTALLGNYTGTPSVYSTILDGISDRFGGTARVYYSQGCRLAKRVIDTSQDKDPAKSKEIEKMLEIFPDGPFEPDYIPEAVMYAKKSDVVILCLGFTADLEGEEGAGQADRPSIRLPGRQEELLDAVSKTGKPVVLLLVNGGPVTITDHVSKVNAILELFYPGEEAGKAAANLLLGDVNPGGRLPYTVVRDETLLPPIIDYSMEGRTYRYMKDNVLFPFGFGLSYTSFSYALKNAPAEINAGDDFSFVATVKNTGQKTGDTVVQAYITDREAGAEVPLRQLAAFRRVTLRPGEEKDIPMIIEARQLAVIREDGRCVLEPGSFTLSVGGTQPDEVSRSLSGDNIVLHDFVMKGGEKIIPY